jgi:quinol monooxygenase YgiN
MAKVIVQHHVADFEQWYPVFKEHGEVRRSHGATGHTLHRGVDDPDTILIVNSFSSLEGARAFMTDPSLKDVMARAGVDSEPQVWVMDETESLDY